jgi:acetoacetyl-CoA synthetase
MTALGELVWTPTSSRVEHAAITRFRVEVADARLVDLPDSRALHRWSVADPDAFWDEVWTRLGVVGDRGEGPAFAPGPTLPATGFFPDARLNVVDTLLARRGSGTALVAVREDGARRAMTWDEVAAATAATATWLEQMGVGVGDRVAAWMPNLPETLITMLAAASLGAVFTSASQDFGVGGVLDRFAQVEPTVLLAADGYTYGGRRFDRRAVLADIVAGLPGLRAVLLVPNLEPDLDDAERAIGGVPVVRWADAQATHADAPLRPVPLAFDHPWYVLYSSGTTGRPKAIVHRAGGVLLKHLVEHRLHCDVRPGDVVLYFTTCGWMMWNWLASALGSGATVVLVDGSPLHPRSSALFDVVQREGVTLFGTSAKYLDGVAALGLSPMRTHRLPALRTLTSTGSPLSPERFAWVHEHVAADLHLASISGGTDIVGCFVLGDPTLPVHAGEIQAPALGLDVDVLDADGRSLRERPGERGELVCTTPFPSMPLTFWGAGGDERYRAAYFDRFPGVWAHGDFAAWTEHGGLVIHGRSDATLNVGGVRIGTAELYRQAEQVPGVLESLAIAQEWGGDSRIVLFVRLADGVVLDDALRAAIKRRLKDQCSPRHVPARIVAVADLPRTRSGKLAELAVADVVHGRPVVNTEALANPECLAAFAGLPELAR